MWGSTQNLDPTGSAILTFIFGHKQTDRQEKYIIYADWSLNAFWNLSSNKLFPYTAYSENQKTVDKEDDIKAILISVFYVL